MSQGFKEITTNGLWHNNPALVQLLGLCPLLAVTSTVANALGLGLATLLVLVGSNTIVSLIRNHVSDAVRLPVFVMVIASFVTCTEMLMKAYTYELYQILGIFVPLIVTNCAILGRAEGFASKNSVGLAALDGFMMGLGFLLVLVALWIIPTNGHHWRGSQHVVYSIISSSLINDDPQGSSSSIILVSE